jgi:CRISPR-associated protein Cmr3
VSIWLIEPRDPLVARDGRPAQFGGRLSTLAFPFPSLLAGAVRTRLGAGTDGPFLLHGAALEELKRIAVAGPLLAEIAELAESDGEHEAIADWLPPAPRDALLLAEAGRPPALHRLLPRSDAREGGVDTLPGAGLLPVAPARQPVAGKPPAAGPAFWRWQELERWLATPADRDEVDLAGMGIGHLPVERRSHLAIEPGERVGIDGMLFETAGLRFALPAEPLHPAVLAPRLAPRRLALSLRCAGEAVAGRTLALAAQLAPLGGERRLARWRQADRGWPTLPAAVRQAVTATRRARLVLLTPALFGGGALPRWSGGAWPGGGPVRATVRAACVPRPEVVSGWDLATGQAKPTRRLAAAGGVYFVELAGGGIEELGRWCDAVWLACVSDAEQDRRDGFGLAVVGTWEEAPA